MSASGLRRETVEISSFQINHSYNQNFAGYFTYWKLILQLYPIANTSINLNTQGHLSKKILPWMVVIMKTPWWAFVKPLGCFFSYTQNLRGTYQVVDHCVGNHAIHKTTILKFLKIPFFTYSSKPSSKDWKERILKNQKDVVFEEP